MEHVTEKFECFICGNRDSVTYADKDAIQDLVCSNCKATIPADEHRNIVFARLHFNTLNHQMPIVKEGAPYPLVPPFFEDLLALPTNQDFYIEID